MGTRERPVGAPPAGPVNREIPGTSVFPEGWR